MNLFPGSLSKHSSVVFNSLFANIHYDTYSREPLLNIGLETMVNCNGVGGFGNAGYQSLLGLSFGAQVFLFGKRKLDEIKSDLK